MVRKSMWVLTWRAWLLLSLVVAASCVIVVRGAHAFLALNAPVNADVLVVEGWMPHYDMTNFIAHHTNYSMIYSIGGPTHMAGDSRNVSDTYASVGYWHLRRVGVSTEKLRMVPSWVFSTDRTYGSAMALREWVRTNHVELRRYDIVSIGPHARRSRLLHQKAFNTSARIGVISLVNGDYDPHHWWRYSEGVKETLSEGAAYMYARFFFFPK